ncbi:MAG: 5-carboxymethyl-2-hydroxymuconate isomerase [Deltaproteobacteria bacterium HGW-Deltaproteobacteria-21]|nr:MAG: 5-carboxymethyl-2-hydroxymuconate isomerase [Deltaproteobacteria bacterium HGW-Deltaproteobacteria-21]
MPHCILEYSANVVDRPDVTRLLKEIHDALMATGLFTLTDIKSRVLRHEQYFIGDGDPDRAFVTLNVQILQGRSDEVKAQISEPALQVLKRAFPETLRQRKCSLTVQVSEIHRPSYRRN